MIYQFNVETNLEHMPGSLLEITAKFGIVQKQFQVSKTISRTQQFHRKKLKPQTGQEHFDIVYITV